MLNKAVFLDRDGTIAYDAHYCSTPDNFHLMPSVPEAISLLNSYGFKVILVTNQSGLARGLFDEKALEQIHNKMHDVLKKYSAHIDAVYYCPHHPDDNCDCRKPGTALFRKAAAEHGLDLAASYVIGDTQMDIGAGKALGCKTVLVTTGPSGGKDITDKPDQVSNTLLEAAKWITGMND